MKIVYIGEKHRTLKKHNIYDALKTKVNSYLVKIENGDFDIRCEISEKSFITLEEWREKRINEILKD